MARLGLTALDAPLLIAGWSVRAAAHSARRAGLSVAAVDAFLDADLRRAAVVCRRVTDMRRLAEVAAEMPPGEWLYVGGLENHPDVVAEISRRHRLLGTGAAALGRLRDPLELQRVVTGAGLPFPESRRADQGTEALAAGRWLVKRRRSAGGVGVARWNGSGRVQQGAYLQEFIAGEICGATFVAAGGRSRLIGVCRQFCAAADATLPFLYGGSIGPLVVDDRLAEQLGRLGDAIAADFDVVGLFGVDFILAPDGVAWPLEVNPRYTASVEILERAAGAALLAMHLDACLAGVLPVEAASCRFQNAAGSRVYPLRHGKRIVYHVGEADHIVTAPCSARWLEQAEHTATAPAIADIPIAGTHLRPGDPIVTVFAAAESDDEVARRLVAAERRLLDDLRSTP